MIVIWELKKCCVESEANLHNQGLVGTCITFGIDPSNFYFVANLAAFGISTFQHIDIVVANAGAGTYGLITELPLTEWKRIIDLCLTGVFLTLKHGGAVISDGGSIINIASLNAIQPSQGMSAYCAAKAGVSMLTQVAAMELGSRGVRVNTIAPGLVETNATSGMFSVPVIIEEFKENAIWKIYLNLLNI